MLKTVQVVRNLPLRPVGMYLISVTEKKRECLIAIILLNEASEKNVHHKVLPWGKMAVARS